MLNTLSNLTYNASGVQDLINKCFSTLENQCSSLPTDPFSILEPKNSKIPELHKLCIFPDFGGSEMVKSLVGHLSCYGTVSRLIR